MLGLSDATNTRLVPMTAHQSDWLRAAVKHLRMDGHTHVADMVESIVQQRDAAPADPAEAIMTALAGMGLTGRSRPDAEVAARILACLGCALPRNEDHA